MDVSDPLQSQETRDAPFVIGTAGHVDHGKSTLVRALTGIDPDRLAEEREREMTIDLGFAWLALPDGRVVSVVDVPGHERFVRNMLAGVGGFDLAMLVVAADDGPMPQTREHLAIIDLLGIERGIVAVSRVDLVDDEWRDLVVEEARELIAGTSMAGAPVVAVSAVSGEGLDALTATIAAELDRARSRDASGHARLPVDRAFHVSGFGTVVTGTLLGGEIATGQELTLYPEGRPARVRGIQAHRRQVDSVRAGSRVAVNLGGVDHRQVRRGHVLAAPGALSPSMRLDCQITILGDAPLIVEQNHDLIAFIGAAEVPARLTLLDRERIGPGEQGWVQLRLAQPVVAMRGDRLILRRPSPAVTIGGGVVVDPAPQRHKRFQPALIAGLDVLRRGTPEDLLLQELGDRPMELGSLHAAAGLTDVAGLVAAMLARGTLVALGAPGVELSRRTVVMRASAFERLAGQALDAVRRQHASRPLEAGLRRDELRAALGIGSQRVFDDVTRELELRGDIRVSGAVLALPAFRIELTPEQREDADAFLGAARAEPYSPPPPQAFGLTEPMLSALESMGELVRVDDQIAYPADVFTRIQEAVMDKLDRDTTITLAEFRDLFGTSRKYAQATLEHLDEQRVTRRKGDVRVRFRGPGAN